MRKYYLTNSKEVSKLLSYQTHGTILNWHFFSVEEIDFEKVKELAPRNIEVEKDIAIWGFRSWGETRDQVSVYNTDIDIVSEFEGIEINAVDPEDTQGKVKITFSDKRKSLTILAMKLVAKVMIEDEYDHKYRTYLSRTSSLERESWKYQLTDPDFRGALADLKGKEIEEFESVVIANSNSHETHLKGLYIECQTLKQQFYDAETIADLSILFEDKFNIPMQSHLAIELGREVVNVDKPNTRTDVGIGLNF